MSKYTWFRDSVPKELPVKQVYGIVFSIDGRVILRKETGKYKLTGGTPENIETFEETLKREYIEELNIELEDIFYLGYLEVNDNAEKYAQVRMIAKIKNIHDCRPDPATGMIYERELVHVDKIALYLNYPDDAGNKMIVDAIEMARKMGLFAEKQDKQFWEKV